MRHATAVLVLPALLLLAPLPATAWHHEQRESAAGLPATDLISYWRIVARYQARELRQAVNDIATFGFRRVESALTELQRRAAAHPAGDVYWSPERVQVAAVMHTQFVTAGLIELPTERTGHLGFARRLVDSKKPHGGPRGSDGDHLLPASFRKRWYLFVTCWAQYNGDLDLIAEYVDAMERQFPRDADVLLSAGSFAETLAWPRLESMGGEAPNARRRGSRGQRLETAEAKFRAALEVAPDLAEARLRLARVIFERGRAVEAIDTLTPLFALDDARVHYLARLFAGAACEGLNRWKDAAAHYRAAVRQRPELATPHVALSHALRQIGEVAGASVEADEALRSGGRVDDPWWTYYFGQGYQAARLGAELLEEVLQ